MFGSFSYCVFLCGHSVCVWFFSSFILLFLPSFLSFLIKFKTVVLKSLTGNSKACASLASLSRDVFSFFELTTFHHLLSMLMGFVENWKFESTPRSVDWLHVSEDPRWSAEVQGFSSLLEHAFLRGLCAYGLAGFPLLTIHSTFILLWVFLEA